MIKARCTRTTRARGAEKSGAADGRVRAAAKAAQALLAGKAEPLTVETPNGPRSFTARDAAGFLRQLLARMSPAPVILDEGIAIFCNGAVARSLGRETLIGEKFADLVVEDDRERFVRLLSEGARTEAAGEAALRKADGAALATRIAAAPVSCLGRDCVILFVTPLDADASRNMALAELAASELRYRTLVAATSAITWSCPASGFQTAPQPEWMAFTGQSAAEMLGDGWSKALHPDDVAITLARWREAVARGEPYSSEHRLRRHDGQWRWVNMRAAPIRAASGEIVEWFGAAADITALVESRATLAAAKAEAERANLAKSKFLAAASHDLRQPVQSLVLLLPLIERHIEKLPKARQIVGLMDKALSGLQSLLTAILDLSRFDAGGFQVSTEAVHLRSLYERLAAEYRPKASALGLELRVRPLDLWARADPALLERALRNLVENALRYTPRGGVLLAMRRRGERVRLDVIDTGIGVAKDKHAEIFEEFRQLDNPGRDLAKGSGLGLATVARIANALGSEVELSSRPGRGSRFSLSLPVTEPAAPAIAHVSDTCDDGGCVLVIEDNQVLRFAIEASLVDGGCRAILASSGEEAMELSKITGAGIDAVITDYNLGPGLNGVDAALEIERRIGRALPKILLTGEADERAGAIAPRSFEILRKPVDLKQLRLKLAEMKQARAASQLDI